MSFKELLFIQAANAITLGGFSRKLGRSHRGLGAIFIGHSVVLDPTDYFNDSLRTRADFLESVIRYLRSEGFDIVTLDEAIIRLQSPSARSFVCFTFDDGYKDNLTVALPIFERQSAPFTVFVTTSLINHTANHWWSGLMELIKKHDSLRMNGTGVVYPTRNLKEKLNAYKKMKREAEKDPVVLERLLAMIKSDSISLPEIVARDALTMTELRTLASSPFVDIGAHTTNHPHLSELDINQARLEIVDNKNWLENTLDRQIRHFAYPYGDARSCGCREADLAREAGFHSAVTTRIGNLFPEHLENMMALPRLRLFSRQENLRLIEFQIYGGAGAILNRSSGPAVTM